MKRQILYIPALALTACLTVAAQEPGPADSASVELREVVVSTAPARRMFTNDAAGGAVTLKAEALRQMPSLLGIADPLRALQALPAVMSGGDIGGGLYVQGCDASQNAVTINGHRLFNPMHMLGLFSTFNAPHFSDFELRPAPSVRQHDAVGAALDARTRRQPDTTLHLEAGVGLIESHASLRLPMGSSSLTLSGRLTYVDLLFGKSLKIDHIQLGYGFHDLNADWTWQAPGGWLVKADAAWTHDRTGMDDELYSADGRFRWQNIVGGVSADRGGWHNRVGYSRFANRFDLIQGGSELDLLSAVSAVELSSSYTHRGLTAGIDAALNIVNPQYDRLHSAPAAADRAATAAVYGEWKHDFPRVLRLTAGARMALFSGGGTTRIYPMPRVSVGRRMARWLEADVSWGMHMQPLHHISMSDVGMPTDYFVNASERFLPQTAQVVSLQLGGSPGLGLTYSLTLYYRRLNNVTEFNGALLNLVNDSYDPLDDLLTGRGRTYGLAASVMKNFGRVTGVVSYTLSRSEGSFEELGDTWLPLAHDRRHDLNVQLTWRPHRNISLSLTGIYASGTPYTKAAYGYMIGENLICEYYPHNSSRLPAYRRMDVGAQWTFSRRRGIEQQLGLSLYNALCHGNTVFQYVTYSPVEGIRHRQASLRLILPSLSYTIIL